ncbi:MAG: DNA-binding protein [Idiomarina sp.]|nr:DNA-binding protein [Idiomarina sp.]
MKVFEFTLKFALPDAIKDPNTYVEALGEAGCDDAIIGIGQKGRLALQFSREADNALEAVTSAIHNVKQAIPNAKLIESAPDLVGLTDIADLLGFTRQYLRKLETTKGNFPQPMHAGKTAIWHLASFLEWYEAEQQKSVDLVIKEIAVANMQINIAKEWAQLDKAIQSDIASISV